MKVIKPKNILILSAALVILFLSFYLINNVNLNFQHKPGELMDSLHSVKVFYNGAVNHTEGRNTSKDGYNIGLKYQCVEFVKRYYYEKYNHKMPDSYGHAFQFFDPKLKDGLINMDRDLYQFTNPGLTSPMAGDIIVFAPTAFNPYGHVAIIAEVQLNQIEIVQQNPGPWGNSRESLGLEVVGQHYKIDHDRVLGWLGLRK